MPKRQHERDFKIENYTEFYSHHDFEPIPDDYAIKVHQGIPRFAWAMDVAKELKPKRLLDLGCLDGSWILTALNHLPDGTEGTGVDLTKDGIAIAQERSALHGLMAEFHQMDIEDFLRVTKHKYDMITLFEIMEHVKDPEYIIKLVDKVLAPGGQVLISTPDFEAPTYGKDDEANKCHIRLYTTADKDYDAVNKYGNTRTASSLPQLLKGYNIVEMDVYNELINARYTR